MRQRPKSEWEGPDLLDEDYWKRPVNEFTRKGDPKKETIATAVGLALSTWQTIEESLCCLFTDLMSKGGPGVGVSHRVYGSVRSEADRRSMIRAAADAYFNYYWAWDDVRRPLEALLAAVSEASARRDDIAHGQLISHAFNDEDLGFFLSSASFRRWDDALEGRRFSFGAQKFNHGRYRYNASDITALDSKWGILNDYIIQYCDDIRFVEPEDLPKNVISIKMRADYSAPAEPASGLVNSIIVEPATAIGST